MQVSELSLNLLLQQLILQLPRLHIRTKCLIKRRQMLGQMCLQRIHTVLLVAALNTQLLLHLFILSLQTLLQSFHTRLLLINEVGDDFSHRLLEAVNLQGVLLQSLVVLALLEVQLVSHLLHQLVQ